MSGELPEDRNVLEVRLEVADVRLVLDDRDAVDIRERIRRVSGLAETAVRGRYAVAGALPVDGGAGIVEVEVTGIKIMLLDGRLLVIVEKTRQPFDDTPGPGSQAQLLSQ